jgi:SAM-dependent methyltransferase
MTAMKDYHPMDSFRADTAAIYDDTAVRGDEESTVVLLAELARGGPVLELAIGTGRIALPLAATGIRVDGIDMSPEMVTKLRAKPGGQNLTVTMGDMAEVSVEGEYRLIFLIFNTLFNLLTQDEQVRCFENVARHLTDDGVFVVEAFTPGWLYRHGDDQYIKTEHIQRDHVQFDAGRHDPVTQTLEETHVALSPDHGVQMFPIVCRYAWPAELDLMARLAGLQLKHRWGGWEKEPFTGDSSNCISVYAGNARGAR